MAAITDILTTILRLEGAALMIQGLQLIANEVKAATDQLIEYDSALLRTQFMLQEFGVSMPTERISEFARALSLASGESQTAIARVEAYLARFRGSGLDIERATRAINNASMATGVSMERIARGLEMARMGRAREFWADLGIQVRGVQGQLYSMDTLVQILEDHFNGFAEAAGGTLPFQIKRASAAFEDMKLQLDRLFSPVVMAGARLLTSFFENMARFAKLIADSMGIALPDLQAAGAGGSGSGQSIQEKQLDYLEKISYNTGPQGPLGRALGAGGSFAAFGGVPIREFNQMVRAVR